MKCLSASFTVLTSTNVYLNITVHNAFQDISIVKNNDGPSEFTPDQLHKKLDEFDLEQSDKAEIWRKIYDVANDEMRSKIWKE